MTSTQLHSQGVSFDEIIQSLEPLNHVFFHIDDLSVYANKVINLAKQLTVRSETGDLLAYVLYYDNNPEIFITMVWTKPGEEGKGLASGLVNRLIESANKDILLEVHAGNPAKFLYRHLKFRQEEEQGSVLKLRYHHRLSVMQPYTFPYIGYFHLIEASDQIVFYDDVQFIKGGWINRNRILMNGNDFLFTIPLQKASPNKMINEIAYKTDYEYRNKFLMQIKAAYGKAPKYKDVNEMLMEWISQDYASAADLAIQSVISVYDFLGKPLRWSKSSVVAPDSKGLDKSDRLIHLNKTLGYTKYINPIGGSELYDKEYFKQHGIELTFVKPQTITYRQFSNDHVPWLSIIDVLMFNDKRAVKEMLAAYEIV